MLEIYPLSVVETRIFYWQKIIELNPSDDDTPNKKILRFWENYKKKHYK